MRYYKVVEAAKILEITFQGCYQAIRRKALKAVKKDGILYTTDEWIGEYLKNLHSKQDHAFYNGRKTFSDNAGEHSVKWVSEKFGIPQHLIYYYIKKGYVKAFRKGFYWVIPIDEMENVQKASEEHKKIA